MVSGQSVLVVLLNPLEAPAERRPPLRIGPVRMACSIRQGDSKRRGVKGIRRDPEAEELWGRDYANTGMYADLSRDRPGLFGIVTARAAPQVLRLALIFAVLDGKDQISATHLLAAREVWRYCEESARYIFGEALQNTTANEILAALRAPAAPPEAPPPSPGKADAFHKLFVVSGPPASPESYL